MIQTLLRKRARRETPSFLQAAIGCSASVDPGGEHPTRFQRDRVGGITCEKEQSSGNEKLYDRIATIEGIKELSPKNICQDTSEIPFTSMLAFKGLECKHVVLVINGRTNINTLELYIGMTRAIIDIQLLVLQ